MLETLQTEDIANIDFGRGDTQLQQCFSDIKRVEARVGFHAPTVRGLWLNLARTPAFRATTLLRRANGFSLSRKLNQYLGGEDRDPVQASLSRSPHRAILIPGENWSRSAPVCEPNHRQPRRLNFSHDGN